MFWLCIPVPGPTCGALTHAPVWYLKAVNEVPTCTHTAAAATEAQHDQIGLRPTQGA
jgi:hypothetical protein